MKISNAILAYYLGSRVNNIKYQLRKYINMNTAYNRNQSEHTQNIVMQELNLTNPK